MANGDDRNPEAWVGRSSASRRPRGYAEGADAGGGPGTPPRPQGWRAEDDYTLSTNRQSGPYRGYGPEGYRRSDERIREDVCDRLTEHGGIDATAIRVDVQDGEVTLEGTVGERVEKWLAEEVADSVMGVHDVHNHLRVRRHHRGRETDRSGDRNR